MKNNRGFSLAELLVVIAVVAIGASIATPLFSDYSRSAQLKSDAQTIYSLLQDAKMLAIKEQKNIRIFFDTAATPGSMTVYSDAGPNGSFDNGGDDVIHKSFVFHTGTTFGHGSATKPMGSATTYGTDNVSFVGHDLEFTSRGLSDSSGYVYIQNTKNQSYVNGAWTTGLVLSRRWSEDWK